MTTFSSDKFFAQDGAHRSGFIAVVGPANAGKSTLVNTLVGKKVSIVSKRPQTTRLRIMGVRDTPTEQLVFIDTPGFLSESNGTEINQLLERSVEEAVSGVDRVLLVIDGAKALRRKGDVGAVAASLRTRGVRRIDWVAFNKVDLLKKQDVLLGLQEIHAVLKDHYGDSVPELFPLSAEKGFGTAELLSTVTAALSEGPKYFPPGTISDLTEERVISETIREKAFRLLHEEIPYSTAVIVNGRAVENGLLRIHATIVVERDSQKGIVIGKGGSMIKELGTLARRDLETLFGARVHLDLVVRVEKNWSHTEKGLQKILMNS